MKNLNDDSLSRRSFITLAALGSASLLVPSIALADTGANQELNAGGETGEIFMYPNMTPAEFEAMLRKQAEEEAARIIAEAEAKNPAGPTTRARPGYETVYESTRYVSSGYRNVSGQPSAGTYFPSGGYIYVSSTGGANISISVPAPWGSIGLSVPFGTKVNSGGFAIWVPGGRYSIAQQNATYACQPFTVWYTDSYGNRSVYRRSASATMYSSSYRYV